LSSSIQKQPRPEPACEYICTVPTERKRRLSSGLSSYRGTGSKQFRNCSGPTSYPDGKGHWFT